MGDDGYYGSNDWYGGKLGEEEDDPDWEFPHESGSRKRKRSHITDWYRVQLHHSFLYVI